MQYQTLRSVSDHHVFVVCALTAPSTSSSPTMFASRARGRVQHRGEVERLKPSTAWRRRDGYALVTCELAVFKPEA